MPTPRATDSAVARLSPVAITRSMPAARSSARASAVVGFTESAIAIAPARRPAIATRTTV